MYHFYFAGDEESRAEHQNNFLCSSFFDYFTAPVLKLGLASGQDVPILDFSFQYKSFTKLRNSEPTTSGNKHEVHNEELQECEGP